MNLDRHDASADRHLRLLPSDPIGFLYWHHYSQAICCELLVGLADNLNHRHSEEEASAVLHYIRHELPRHELDEEQELHGLATDRQSAGTGTRIDLLFAKLTRPPRTDRALSAAVLHRLIATRDGAPARRERRRASGEIRPARRFRDRSGTRPGTSRRGVFAPPAPRRGRSCGRSLVHATPRGDRGRSRGERRR